MHFSFRRFASREDGSLLVFFLISVVTILGIVALSFDLGRRASTQTDMQSFADNVALAAAGELDGGPNAIARATWAANNAIAAANEGLKGGVAGTTATLSIDSLVFYSDLPDTDRPGSFAVGALSDPTNASYKYALPTTSTTSVDAAAAFVGVRLTPVDVGWIFGNVFAGGNDLNNLDPGSGRRVVSAVAVAGNSAWTCDVAPLMFCLPQSGGEPVELEEGWAVRLRTSRRNAAWGPGDFGFLDVGEVPSTTCGSLLTGGGNGNSGNEARWQACLLAQGLGQCFNSRRVDIQTGQRNGQETANFNVPFGVFTSTLNQFENNPIYAPGPHAVTGQIYPNNSCQNPVLPTPRATMDFPPDDCHRDGNCIYDRFGDGDWSDGRTAYADTNYTFTKPNGTVIDGSDFFDFPEANLTRYQYYLREIERAANGGVMEARYGAGPNDRYAATNDGGRTSGGGGGNNGGGGGNNGGGGGNNGGGGGNNGGGGGNNGGGGGNNGGGGGNNGGGGGNNGGGGGNSGETVDEYANWDDYWPNTPAASHGINPIIPDALGRVDNGLPQCGSATPTANSDRRVLIVAGIDCTRNPIGGTMPGDVPVHQYYRTFLMGPARQAPDDEYDTTNGPVFDIWVEIIEDIGGEAGGSTTDAGIFREVIQLYK